MYVYISIYIFIIWFVYIYYISFIWCMIWSINMLYTSKCLFQLDEIIWHVIFPVTWRIEAIGGWDDGSIFRESLDSWNDSDGNPWLAETWEVLVCPLSLYHARLLPPNSFWNISELVKILPTRKGSSWEHPNLYCLHHVTSVACSPYTCVLALTQNMMFEQKNLYVSPATFESMMFLFPFKKDTFFKKQVFPEKKFWSLTPLLGIFLRCSVGKFRWAQQPVVCWWRLPGGNPGNQWDGSSSSR